MNYTVHIPSDDVAILHCHGMFTLEDIEDFRKTTDRLLNKAVRRILMNMRDITHIDSSAIGELILFMNAAKNRNIDLILVDVVPDIINILRMAHLDRFFKISTTGEIKKKFPNLTLKP